jgi:hypothetical protein
MPILNEKEWMKEVRKRLEKEIFFKDTNLSFYDGKKVPYSFEIISYKDNKPEETNLIKYETDLIICQNLSENEWKPRIIIEGKLNSVTTHDAITYSQKAATHKNVHPFLRYGILIGNRKHFPLPGRLFRHGAHFDFMLSWVGHKPTDIEWEAFVKLIKDEIKYSQQLEEMIFHSRSRNRKHYTVLQRRLYLKNGGYTNGRN